MSAALRLIMLKKFVTLSMPHKRFTLITLIQLFIISFACGKDDPGADLSSPEEDQSLKTEIAKDSASPFSFSENQLKVLEGAKQTLAKGYSYDMSMAYYTIPFPGGDIDPSIGVCTDVVIRALRLAGIADLQLELNKDIKANWNKYPMKRWNSKKADPNIDHRRVMNLKAWFERHWQTKNKIDFEPGDIVIWDMDQDGASDHTGIVSDKFEGKKLKVIHNHPNPGYVAEEDKLHLWKITGHYRINE
jgi:uncharacterized protein YijF (DUF1287 family)